MVFRLKGSSGIYRDPLAETLVQVTQAAGEERTLLEYTLLETCCSIEIFTRAFDLLVFN